MDHERPATSPALEFRNRQQRRFLAHGFEVGARETVGPAGEPFEIDVGSDRHTRRQQSRTIAARRPRQVSQANDIVNRPLRKSAGPPVGAVVAPAESAFNVAEIVDLTQQLAENPLVDIGAEVIAAQPRRDRVDRGRKRRQGAARLAFLKTSRSAFSDSPSHFE